MQAEYPPSPVGFGWFRNKTSNQKTSRQSALGVQGFICSCVAPCALPSSVVSILGSEPNRVLASLVYSEILQVREDYGDFESGPDSRFVQRELGRFGALADPAHVINFLSRSAMQYGASLVHLDEFRLATRLYRFNSYPRALGATYKWDAAWINGVGNRRKMALALLLRSHYSRQVGRNSSPSWIAWEHKRLDRKADLRYKLYVSPTPADSRAAFASVTETCCTLAVPAFKIGADVDGILRPDKIVLYFATLEATAAAAAELRRHLDGCGVQGVLFSQPLDERGLLSRAADPLAQPLETAEGNSWRMYVASCAARSLKLASMQAVTPGPPDLLLNLRLSGIDPNDWNGNLVKSE